jgi:death-on-curing protein
MTSPGQWRWVSLDVSHAVHDRQISEHGGGVRDAGLIDSALTKPQNLAAYGALDAAALAAAYAYGIARNHGFVDRNKRTAWVVARLFLADNGYRLAATPKEVITIMEALAAGEIDETALAAWFRERVT